MMASDDGHDLPFGNERQNYLLSDAFIFSKVSLIGIHCDLKYCLPVLRSQNSVEVLGATTYMLAKGELMMGERSHARLILCDCRDKYETSDKEDVC